MKSHTERNRSWRSVWQKNMFDEKETFLDWITRDCHSKIMWNVYHVPTTFRIQKIFLLRCQKMKNVVKTLLHESHLKCFKLLRHTWIWIKLILTFATVNHSRKCAESANKYEFRDKCSGKKNLMCAGLNVSQNVVEFQK